MRCRPHTGARHAPRKEQPSPCGAVDHHRRHHQWPRGLRYLSAFPIPLPQVLADLRVLGECFQSDVDRQTLARLVPTGLVSEYVDLPGPVRTHRGRMPDRASPAVGTAIGVLAAMSVVGQADIESAAEVLSSIWPRGRKGSLSSRI